MPRGGARPGAGRRKKLPMQPSRLAFDPLPPPPPPPPPLAFADWSGVRLAFDDPTPTTETDR